MPETPGQETAARRADGAAAQLVIVTVVTGLIVFVRLGATTLDDHEAKAALAARTMLRPEEWIAPAPGEKDPPPNTPLNHWLVPINNGRPRLVKTPLPYWCIAGSGRLAGGVDEWSARLPSALAAVALAWITLAIGRRMLGARAGLLGALILATSVGFQKWGRDARPEMLLCLFLTAAMACFWGGLTASTRRRRAGWMIAFWLAMALAQLSKQFFPLLAGLPLAAFVFWREEDRREEAQSLAAGTARRRLRGWLIAFAAAIVAAWLAAGAGADRVWARLGVSDTLGSIALKALLIGLPLAWYAWRSRPWRAVASLLPTGVPGAILMFAAFLPWMWYMRRLFPGAGDIFSEQVAERAAGTGKWTEAAPHYYFLPLLTMTLPWVGLLPGALAAAWVGKFRKHRHALTYLFLWTVGLIGLLTVSAGKREHYILPILPAASLLMGFVGEDVFSANRWLGRVLGRRLGIAYALVCLAIPVAMGAALAISLAGADWIAARIASEELPSRSLLALREWDRWLHMLIVSLAAAVPAGLALAASRKGRLGAGMGLLTACFAVVLVGFHAGGRLWDDRAPAVEFARRAAAIVPAGEPVASVADPQDKTVFYFGRNIPNMYLLAGEPPKEYHDGSAHLAAFLGEARYRDFLRDRRKVRWLFAYGQYAEPILPLGYRVALRAQGEQQKKTVFTLLENTGSPSTTSTRNPGGGSPDPPP